MNKIYRESKNGLHFMKRPNINFPVHIHEEIELVYVINGKGNAFCAGKKYELEDNTFFMVFPNQVHHYSEFTDGKYITIIVNPKYLNIPADTFLNCLPASALLKFEEKADENLISLIKTALKEFERDGEREIILAYLSVIFGKLIKLYKIQKCTVPKDTVSKILGYCTEHYQENITVADVANALYISRSSVSHLFGSRLSIGFCDYINSLRLIDAEKMLKKGNLSVTEISSLCGFSTIRTFNRAFLKRYGKSPTEYKKGIISAKNTVTKAVDFKN